MPARFAPVGPSGIRPVSGRPPAGVCRITAAGVPLSRWAAACRNTRPSARRSPFSIRCRSAVPGRCAARPHRRTADAGASRPHPARPRRRPRLRGGAIAAAVAFSPLPPYARFRPSRIPFAGLRSHVSSAAWRRFATRIQVPSAGRPRRRWWWAAFYSASSTCPRRLPVPGRLIRSRHLPPAACRTVCGRCTSNTCSGTVPSGRGSSRRGLPVRPDRPPCTAPHPCVIRPMYESAIAGMHGPASRLGI